MSANFRYTKLEAFPSSKVALGGLGLCALAIAVVAGASPLVQAAEVLVAAAVMVTGFIWPNITLVALIASVPFQGYGQLSLGPLRGSSTDFLLALLVLGWVARGLRQRELRLAHSPILLAGLAYFGAALLTSQSVEFFPKSAAELIKLAELIVVILYASSMLTNARDVRIALVGLTLAGSAESLIALRQFTVGGGPESFSIGRFTRAYGDFEQPNVLAGYLASVLPFAITLAMERGKVRVWGITSTALVGAALFATLSRGAWLGTLIGLSLMIGLASPQARRGLFAVATAGAGVLGIGALVGLPTAITDRLGVLVENFGIFDVRTVDVDATNWSVVERMAHWQAGWAMALDHPWLGVGPGNYEAAYDKYFLPGWPFPLGHAHNFYINTFAEMGIVGLMALAALGVTVFVRISQGIRQAGPGAGGARLGLEPVGRPSSPLPSWPSALPTPLLAVGAAGPISRADPDRLRRRVCLAALAALTAFSIHNMFDNMLVHGMAVQIGLILGLVEGAGNGWDQAGPGATLGGRSLTSPPGSIAEAEGATSAGTLPQQGAGN